MGGANSELSQQQQPTPSLAPPSPFTATAPLNSTASTHVSLRYNLSTLTYMEIHAHQTHHDTRSVSLTHTHMHTVYSAPSTSTHSSTSLASLS